MVAMALGSALGFGLFYVFVDAGTAAAARAAAAARTSGSHGSPLHASPLWVIAGARMSSLVILSTIALVATTALAGRRSVLRWPGRRLGPVALVGIADTGANLLFAYAAGTGNLAVVGVLGSLYRGGHGDPGPLAAGRTPVRGPERRRRPRPHRRGPPRRRLRGQPRNWWPGCWRWQSRRPRPCRAMIPIAASR